MDVKRESRKARGVSKPAPPVVERADDPAAAAPTAPQPAKPGGKSRWKHDLHRDFARIRHELPPLLVHVWEIMWDHLPATNEPFWLSGGTIALEGCIHPTAARRTAAELERLGLVVCIARGTLGRPDANLWRFPQTLPQVPKKKRRKPPARKA
jgi:hypothetical protein